MAEVILARVCTARHSDFAIVHQGAEFTRSMVYKDMLYKDQNFPSTERLCSDDVIVTT